MDRRIGTHRLQVDGDILKYTLTGPFTLDDAKAFNAVAVEHLKATGYLLILSDITNASSMSADARRYNAAKLRESTENGFVHIASASFGTGTIARGMIALLYAMLRITSGGNHINHMAKNEAEARAFLAEQRQYFLTQRQPP